jgi:hypothetical protein
MSSLVPVNRIISHYKAVLACFYIVISLTLRVYYTALLNILLGMLLEMPLEVPLGILLGK